MENAPGEGGRRVQNEGPEGSWELLGAMWAQGGRRERLKSLLAAARRPKKFMWRLLGASWGGKLIDFSFQEAGQERPGASRRACRRAFLRLRFWERPRGPTKCKI